MKKWTRWDRGSWRSRRSTWQIWLNSATSKRSTKTRKKTYSIPSDSRKNKSRNSRLSCPSWWVKTRSTILSTTRSGVKRSGSGRSPILHIRRRWWICPNCQSPLPGICESKTRRRKWFSGIPIAVMRRRKKQPSGSITSSEEPDKTAKPILRLLWCQPDRTAWQIEPNWPP